VKVYYDRIKTTTSTVRQKNRKFQRFCIFKVRVKPAYLIEMTRGREPVLLTSLNEDLTDHCIHIGKSFSGLLHTYNIQRVGQVQRMAYKTHFLQPRRGHDRKV